VGRYGRTVSLQHLDRGGARLLGRLNDIEGDEAVFADDLLENIRFADERSAFIKAAIDKYVETRGLDAPPREDDPADHPAGPDVGSLVPTRLDLRKEEIFSVVWCTGFDADFNWIDLPVLDHAGYPMHERGLSPAPGLFFVGFPWLQTRKSGLILGVEEDSKHIAEEISQHLASVHDQAHDRGK
jgi:putative flavoprotein involved in K+ transport